MSAGSIHQAKESAPTVIGEWHIERELGAGAMGEVYLARRERQQAALKVVAKRFAGDDAFIQRFQREISVLAKLNHPGVANALSWGQLDGRPWLAMEFIPGLTVEWLLAKHGPFLESDVLALAIQVARGLEHIHQRAGLIHRDVKPANIIISRAAGGDPNRLLNPGDQAKLIDFGLAKAVEQPGEHGLTMTGMIMGTPDYIAPEQVQCERALTLHVDMYALGATMYHLLTGHVPFAASSAAAVMVAHLNQPVPDPGTLVPGISAATRALVKTCLAKTAAGRFADWDAFVLAVEQAQAVLAGGRAGTGSLLRKPMVRPTEEATAKPAARPRPSSEPHAAISDMSALEAHAGDGSAALRAAVTARIARVQTSQVHRKAGGAVPQASGAKTSAVHRWSGRLESQGTTGGAMLPWVMLGLSALATIAGIAWVLAR